MMRDLCLICLKIKDDDFQEIYTIEDDRKTLNKFGKMYEYVFNIEIEKIFIHPEFICTYCFLHLQLYNKLKNTALKSYEEIKLKNKNNFTDEDKNVNESLIDIESPSNKLNKNLNIFLTINNEQVQQQIEEENLQNQKHLIKFQSICIDDSHSYYSRSELSEEDSYTDFVDVQYLCDGEFKHENRSLVDDEEYDYSNNIEITKIDDDLSEKSTELKLESIIEEFIPELVNEKCNEEYDEDNQIEETYTQHGHCDEKNLKVSNCEEYKFSNTSSTPVDSDTELTIIVDESDAHKPGITQKEEHCADIENDFKTICIPCQKIFLNKSSYIEHKKKEHIRMRYQCELCPKVSYSKEASQVHKNIHDGLPAFQCFLCTKNFKQKIHYTIHMMDHTNQRNEVCQICKKKFKTKSDLKIHLRGHTGERPYICDICNKSFRVHTHLKNHRYSHFEKQLECNICNQKYVTPASLKTHIRSVHEGLAPYECMACQKKFKRSHHLKVHMNTHNKKKCNNPLVYSEGDYNTEEESIEIL